MHLRILECESAVDNRQSVECAACYLDQLLWTLPSNLRWNCGTNTVSELITDEMARFLLWLLLRALWDLKSFRNSCTHFILSLRADGATIANNFVRRALYDTVLYKSRKIYEPKHVRKNG